MSRSAIQVPSEVKKMMEEYKRKMRASSMHELIQILIHAYERNVHIQAEQEKSWEDEKQRQQTEMVQLGEESKRKYEDLKQELKFENDVSLFEFLREHYQNSKEISNTTFLYYRGLE